VALEVHSLARLVIGRILASKASWGMTSIDITAAPAVSATRVAPRRFYQGMAIVFLVTVAVGFFNSTRSRVAMGAPLVESLVLVHAALFASWFVIFLVQSMLASKGRLGLHRRLGYMAAAVAASISIDGPYTAVAAARRGSLGSDGLAFMFVMIGDVVGFAVFVAIAIYYRRRPETHKRFMLLGTTSMLPPAIIRWPWITGQQGAVGIVMIAYLAVAPLNDLICRRRVHAVSLWGGIALLVSVPIRFAISQSAAWHQFASWLVR
jgi:hypothetical protein